VKVPLYDYKCAKCDYETEELIFPGNDYDDVSCAQCGSKMERKFPTDVSFRMTDNFIIGREKPTREVEAKLEQYKANPSSDPYAKFRGQ
jgi:putative FmdB family regulatory protein